MKLKIDKVIEQGVNFLYSKQEKDGSFLSLSSEDPFDFTKAIKYHSTFSTSLILSCLSSLPKSFKLEQIKKKAAHFLVKQRSKHWSFNYWARGSKESKLYAYPDDLDDTFTALTALFQYNPKLIDGAVLANVLKILTNAEEKVGGPYRTWLIKTDKSKWLDVDLAVNANIAFFLSLQGIYLPKLKRFIESAIDKKNIKSLYYPSYYPIIYFISRFFQSKKKILKDTLLQNKHAYLKNPLFKSLSLSSIMNLNIALSSLDKDIYYLIKQRKNHFWKPYGFCLDPQKKDKKYFCGSAYLTTAFCLETLSKYLDIKFSKISNVEIKDLTKLKIYNQIVKTVNRRFADKALKNKASNILRIILKKVDKNEQITLLPYYFKSSLDPKLQHKITDELLVQLGAANLFGWIAYTIYDDFLDNEGDIRELSLANIALRELTSIFDNILPKQSGFKEFFHKVLDGMDSANIWEVINCRKKEAFYNWGNYKKLAERSLGHGLGPMAILFALGYKSYSFEVKNLIKFFNHFLIAKQLNDDTHDWQKDLKAWHINPVVAKLLIRFEKQDKLWGKLSVNKLMPKLQKLFWYEVITDICKDTLSQLKLAQSALNKSKIITDRIFLEKNLSPIEQSAKQALDEHKETVKFLDNYLSKEN